MLEPRRGTVRRVTRASHAPIAWSADGRLLMTSTYTSSSSGSISVVDVAAGRVRRLLHGRFVLPQTIARDGRSILVWMVGTAPPGGDLVRVRWDRTRTILVRDADQRADWNA
jgi:hypothetical protein